MLFRSNALKCRYTLSINLPKFLFLRIGIRKGSCQLCTDSRLLLKGGDITSEITTIFYEHKGRYDVMRVHQELLKRSFRVTINEFSGSLAGQRPKEKYHSYKGKFGKIANNIISRDFNTEKPLEKWTTDLSQFNLP